MKHCPICGADIAPDQLTCGKHNTISVPKTADPLTLAKEVAQALLDDANQALLDEQANIASLKTQLSTAQDRMTAAQARVDTAKKILGEIPVA